VYSFDELYQELGKEVSLKTLKNWAIKIEKLTDRKFERRYAKNSSGHTYAYKVFSGIDVIDFKRLLSLRKENVPLTEGMKLIFLSNELKKWQIQTQEMIEMKQDLKALLKLSKEIIAENADLKRRLTYLEEK
jgi:hypothetical protein